MLSLPLQSARHEAGVPEDRQRTTLRRVREWSCRQAPGEFDGALAPLLKELRGTTTPAALEGRTTTAVVR